MKRARIFLTGLALIAAACGGVDKGTTTTLLSPGTSSTGTSLRPVATSGPAPSTTTSVTLASERRVLLSVEAMWEGQMETVVLYSDGLLEAGSSRGQADLTGASDYWMDQQARIVVVELGAAGYQQAILVELPEADDVDPPNRNQLFVVEGQVLRRVLNEGYGVYGVTTLRFLGDGTIEYQEDGWTACGRENYPEEVNRQIVILGFFDDEIGEIGRRDSSDVQRCDELAACPYVYVIAHGGEEFIGEILRDIRGRDAYATQGLALPTHHGLLHIQLREEKEEVTYLDAISLIVDGKEIKPLACIDDGSLSHCSSDRVSLRMVEGDVLDLWFEVPHTAVNLELSATGYYIPTQSD